MSLRLATRRLTQSVGAPSPSCLVPPSKNGGGFAGSVKPTIQCRHKWSVNLFKGWGKSGSKKNTQEQGPVASELDDPKKRQQFLQKHMRGGVEDNIFQDEIEAAPSPAQEAEPARQAVQKTKQSLAMVVDPDPRSRIRWQRRKVIQMVRRNGELTREEKIKMTERELVHKSHFLPTSVKKLVMLARQIAGKPVDEAITQMKWSKKKMAAEIKYYLEEARDLAVAQRGMGLGQVNSELFDKPRKIQTKEGKWLEITDPSRMYVAQSWVGRGAWRGKSIDYKGRGRMGIMQHPTTSFTVVLKEERTRIREFEEQKAKKASKGPWVHLPNRPLYGQRPYYSW
ncbi:54S ribosomal protein L22 [Escovopsis weberi]|uniref:54S ribosomal protein L22 n=1 Tax=Escovopsis weberi TaxID=150374 RepID=A0A0M8N626_ESCWE|nr:54S ribosomal protein L22 [Escovopsis weberi]